MTTLFDEWEVSRWAYLYCKYINDDPKVRLHITNSYRALMYCKYVNDDPEVRKNIRKDGFKL